MRLKIEAGCGIREILKAGCGIKTERRDRDMLCFVGGIRDRTGIWKLDQVSSSYESHDLRETLVSLSNDDGNGNENVT